MKIRKASAKDWPRVRRLIKEHAHVLLQKHLPKPQEFFVAIENGEVVGCCALVLYSKRLSEIRSLAVAKKHQRKGIATLLIDACVASAKKRGVEELIAITGAEKLFAKHRFSTFRGEKFALLKSLKPK